MKIKTTVFCTFVLLLLQATAWSQLQQAAVPYSGNPFEGGWVQNAGVPATYPGGAYPGGAYPGGMYQEAVAPASFSASCDDCGGDCGGTCNDKRFGFGGWGDVEYLLLWGKDQRLPILATTSPAGTASNIAGHIGLPTTSVLFGDEMVGGDPYSGVRLSGGAWLNCEQTFGIGGRAFMVEGEDDWSASSDVNGNPILARPFFNIDSGGQDALLVAYPGISHGSINISADNETRGFDVFVRKLLVTGHCNRVDLIGGYQSTTIEDSVTVSNTLISDDPSRIPLGAQIDTRDYFEIENEFHGGFVGLMSSAQDGRLTWNLLAKVAFGNMNQQATIRGTTTSSVPGVGSSTADVGLLAMPTNIGRFDRDEFAIVPELNVSMGYDCSKNCTITVGYTFIYWSEVALAGQMIDTTLNPTQLTGPLVGPARPSSDFSSDGFWLTGLSIGGSVRF